MNYKALNSMIKNLINWYKCPECQSKIESTDIDIVWAAWTTVNLDILCKKCNRHSMIKSQIIHINLEQIKSIKNEIISDTKRSIQDNQIIKLSKDLKNKQVNVSDIIWE